MYMQHSILTLKLMCSHTCDTALNNIIMCVYENETGVFVILTMQCIYYSTYMFVDVNIHHNNIIKSGISTARIITVCWNITIIGIEDADNYCSYGLCFYSISIPIR